ncbi:hypothetical protein COV18_05740 [Candidatus Woesearchaeota archaeon CG10_big_fil_rev_8_21_14_0_10_37_12]|nr:MAG: hypothetical protein COV18_05740 [Candidatus Woesearchaeota archaeon CG10_big_fil_rev_8_21_14_0_10_37_12]
MKQISQKVGEQVVFQIIKYVAAAVYFAGLASLTPLIPLLLTPTELLQARQIVITAFGFVIVAFLLTLWASKNMKIAFRALGYMTLFPGLLTVITAYIGERRMLEYLSHFGEITPYIQEWIHQYVPTAWIIAGIYIILGVFFIWLGEKFGK